VLRPTPLLLCLLLPACVGPTSERPGPWDDDDDNTTGGLDLPGAIEWGQRASPPPCPAPDEPWPATRFADVTDCAGLQAANAVWAFEYFPVGAAWSDFDGDGALDLFVSDGAGPDRLFAGDGQGRLAELDLGLPDEPVSQSAGVAAADVDEDGDPDLLVTGLGALRLLRNDGLDGWIDATDDSGLKPTPAGASLALGDYDGDGHLDLYAVNYFCGDCEDLEHPADHVGDALYRGLGDGTFTEVTGELPQDAIYGYGFAARFIDVDVDGDLDLYVANDKGSSKEPSSDGRTNRNVLFVNEGPGCATGWCWTEAAAEWGLALELNGMGISVGDVDRDGDLDLAVANSYPPALMLATDAGFVDASLPWGLTTDREGWGLALLDVDNDGDLDLFQPSGSMGDMGGQPDVLWLQEDGAFVDRSATSGMDYAGNTIGAVVGDYDGDGWLDVAVTGLDEPWRLLRNLGGSRPETADHRWIAFDLRAGPGMPSPPVGARVTLEDSDGNRQLRDLAVGASLGVTHEPVLHFGLGDAEVVTATITWPDGSATVLDAPEHGQKHTVAP
jgi:enediyne biosynthesis protein E4